MENLVGFRKQSLDEARLAAGLGTAKRRVALAVTAAKCYSHFQNLIGDAPAKPESPEADNSREKDKK